MPLFYHSSTLGLYNALLLPVFVLYSLVFLSFGALSSKSGERKPLVSLRDAAVATVALDLAAVALRRSGCDLNGGSDADGVWPTHTCRG